MPVEEHLTELRERLIRVLVIFGVTFLLSAYFAEETSNFLLAPLKKALHLSAGDGKIVFFGVLDKITSLFQVAFWSSIFFSSPLWFRELWFFIKPALHDHEEKIIRPFIISGFVFFIVGVCFGHFLLFPFALEMLLSFGVEEATAMLGLKEFLLLSSKVLVLLGFLFELPNILVILGLMGLVTKYSLRKWRPYFYVGFAIFSAFITPPDIFTMMAMWIPLVLLFEIGILAVALIVHPYLARQN